MRKVSSARGVVPHGPAMRRQPPVGRRRHAMLTQEGAIEVGNVEIADLEADIRDRHVAFGQKLAGLPDAQLVDMVGEGVAGVLLEEPGEGAFAHAGKLCDIGKTNVRREVAIDEDERALERIERFGIQLRRIFRRGQNLIFRGTGKEMKELQEEGEAGNTLLRAHAFDQRRALLQGLAIEHEAALGAGKEVFQFREFRQQPHGLADPVRVELQHDIPPFDNLARRRHRHPVVRQVAADDGEIGRREGADIIADERDTRALANEVDLELRMEIPDIALPGIIVEPPEKALVDARDDVLEGRSARGKRARPRLPAGLGIAHCRDDDPVLLPQHKSVVGRKLQAAADDIGPAEITPIAPLRRYLDSLRYYMTCE